MQYSYFKHVKKQVICCLFWGKIHRNRFGVSSEWTSWVGDRSDCTAQCSGSRLQQLVGFTSLIEALFGVMMIEVVEVPKGGVRYKTGRTIFPSRFHTDSVFAC